MSLELKILSRLMPNSLNKYSAFVSEPTVQKI
jgi:hypothetical protein